MLHPALANYDDPVSTPGLSMPEYDCSHSMAGFEALQQCGSRGILRQEINYILPNV